MRKKARYLTAEEVERIETASQGQPCRVGIILALHYGLRLSDITRLRWSDVNMGASVICVDNGKCYRELSLSVEDAAYLQTLYSGKSSFVSPFVWEDVPGQPAASYTVTRAIKRHCAACGVPGVGLKELRHTAIVRKMQEGMRMSDLQEWAGYTEYNAAFLIYADIIRQMKCNKV